MPCASGSMTATTAGFTAGPTCISWVRRRTASGPTIFRRQAQQRANEQATPALGFRQRVYTAQKQRGGKARHFLHLGARLHLLGQFESHACQRRGQQRRIGGG